MTDNEGNLSYMAYGPCKVCTGGTEITCDTLYPFRDTLIFSVKSENTKDMTIRFKVPGWCDCPEIWLGAEREDAIILDGFICVNRVWAGETLIKLRFQMKTSVIKVDDRALANKQPLAVEYGPLLFSLPLDEVWTAYPGNPFTSLPEGWDWYEVFPRIEKDAAVNTYDRTGLLYDKFSWHVAVCEDIDAKRIEVCKYETDGYVWEKSLLTLRLPAHRAKYAFAPYISRINEVYDIPLKAAPEEVMLELVPIGCTAIRISYFPRADIRETR